MKYFIKGYLFCLLISSLLFLNACNGNETRARNGRSKGKTGSRFSCPEAGLSEEQQTQIKELRQNFRGSNKDRDRGNREERQAVWLELQQNILATVPETEEQRAALSDCFKRKQSKH